MGVLFALFSGLPIVILRRFPPVDKQKEDPLTCFFTAIFTFYDPRSNLVNIF